jgi:hypothetical protein
MKFNGKQEHTVSLVWTSAFSQGDRADWYMKKANEVECRGQRHEERTTYVFC